MRSQSYRVNCNYQADANERVQLHESSIGFGHWRITIPHPANRYSHSSSTTFDRRPGREYVTPFSASRAPSEQRRSTLIPRTSLSSRKSHLCHCRIANRTETGDTAACANYVRGKRIIFQRRTSRATTRPASAAVSRTPRRTTRIVADKIALGGNAGTRRDSKEVKGSRGVASRFGKFVVTTSFDGQRKKRTEKTTRHPGSRKQLVTNLCAANSIFSNEKLREREFKVLSKFYAPCVPVRYNDFQTNRSRQDIIASAI